MIDRDKYIEKAEIKVKNLLSDLYESESNTLQEMRSIRLKLNHELVELESDHAAIMGQRKELQDRFELLKQADDAEWENTKEDFELTLKYIEGDRETFINKAENLIMEFSNKIERFENKARTAQAETKKELQKQIRELTAARNELQRKLDIIREDSSDKWRDMKHWFIEKSNSVKDYITSLTT